MNQTTYLIIGATARVGKDTFAHALRNAVDQHNPNLGVEIVSFAGALRHECNKAFNFGQKESLDLWTQEPNLKEHVVRPFLIAWGQARRAMDPDYWVDKMIDLCSSYGRAIEAGQKLPDRLVIVPDWRFPNEWHKLRAHALANGDRFYSVILNRPDVKPTGPDEEKNAPLCASLASHRINNYCTFANLNEQAVHLLREIALIP